MKAVLIVIFLGLGSVAYGQDTDCSGFRTGRFQNTENGVVTTMIKRGAKYQIEEGNDGIKIKLKVEWLDACTYKLTFVKAPKKWLAKQPKDWVPPVVITRITKVEADAYWQSSTIENSDAPAYKSKIERVGG